MLFKGQDQILTEKVVEIELEVGTKRLDNKTASGYFEHIFFMESYLFISCFRLNFFYK